MTKMKALPALLLACSVLAGCISIPETEQELAEGRAEAMQFADVDYSDVELESPFEADKTIHETTTLEELYAELNFNPYGNSLYLVAINDPIGAMYAKSIRDESISMTSKLFPDILAVDNEADAFRHAYFSFRLSQKIGVIRAKKFTDAYEISNINKMGSRCMDLWNNREGRRMYSNTKDSSGDDKRLFAEKKVLNALSEGRLVTSPFKIKDWKK